MSLLKSWRIWAVLLIVGAIGVDFVLFRSGSWRKEQPVVINNIAAPPLPTLDPEQIALGQAVYARLCAACHGANLEGQLDWKTRLADGSLPAPPHDGSGHTWHHPDELLTDIVANGGDPASRSKMPGFQDQLTQAEIAAVLEFLKSTWDREEREYQWWMTTVGDQQ